MTDPIEPEPDHLSVMALRFAVDVLIEVYQPETDDDWREIRSLVEQRMKSKLIL